MPEIMIPVLILSGVGACIAFFLGFAAQKLAVKTDPKVEAVDAVLPAGNCGNCGFAGCLQYAEMVVSDPSVSASLCTPGGNDCAAEIARITGKKAGEIQDVKAVPRCRGCADKNCTAKYTYEGLSDCEAASHLFAGEKNCEYGCLGLGNCTRVCPKNAIRMNADNLPYVDIDLCNGCGLCAKSCPRNIIQIVPSLASSVVMCRSHDKGGATRKNCESGCMGCRICEKTCPHGAMKVIDNLCEIDYEKCMQCKEPVCLVARCKPQVIAPFYGVEVPDRPAPEPKPKAKAKKSSTQNAA